MENKIKRKVEAYVSKTHLSFHEVHPLKDFYKHRFSNMFDWLFNEKWLKNYLVITGNVCIPSTSYSPCQRVGASIHRVLSWLPCCLFSRRRLASSGTWRQRWSRRPEQSFVESAVSHHCKEQETVTHLSCCFCVLLIASSEQSFFLS